MAKRFDATLKDLIETYPGDWLRQLGFDYTGPIEVVDADLSTVTAQADRLFRIPEATPWLHLDLQASRDDNLPRRVLKYNVLAFDHQGEPVHSIVVLLRPEADAPNLTGELSYRPPHRQRGVSISYDVIRLWQRPVASFLEGGLGTLPLAPLCDVTEPELPAVIRRMDERVSREAAPGEAATLWTSTYILMGLRYPPPIATRLLQGVRAMRESSTYQAILQEGREEGREEGSIAEARRLLLLLGTRRFGAPRPEVAVEIDQTVSLERLEELIQRLLEVESWEQLLGA
jgi:predicted transposase YdaD